MPARQPGFKVWAHHFLIVRQQLLCNLYIKSRLPTTPLPGVGRDVSTSRQHASNCESDVHCIFGIHCVFYVWWEACHSTPSLPWLTPVHRIGIDIHLMCATVCDSDKPTAPKHADLHCMSKEHTIAHCDRVDQACFVRRMLTKVPAKCRCCVCSLQPGSAASMPGTSWPQSHPLLIGATMERVAPCTAQHSTP